MQFRTLLLTLTGLVAALSVGNSEPLRVFFRGGEKSHGPDAHEHERFMNDWSVLLAERGAVTAKAMRWPNAEELEQTDVVVAYAQEGGATTEQEKSALEAFVKRGGGLVVLHTATVAPDDSDWLKMMIGGAWVNGTTKWLEGPMNLYYTENQQLGGGHPITHGAANFLMDDEIYYDLDISPDVRVLATSYTPNVPDGKQPASGGQVHVFDIQPMMWAYERTAPDAASDYRAFVCIPGHLYSNFSLPNFRAVILRGIAWAGKLDDIDAFCTQEEIASLTYPEGGPQRPEETRSHLEIDPAFTLDLVAAEPLINKPMNIDWDPAGRMWVAETPEYPNGRRGMRPDFRGQEWKDHGGVRPERGNQDRPAIDKISILTDTDGDGVMDAKEIFYEGLDLVTGLVFYRDGVIVTQAPDILWLRDTDGDGKCDQIEKLYTGLGMGDTHAVINNPRWGWDGWIYATHGYSASNEVLNMSGEKMEGIGSGVVRFRADGSRIEQYSSKGGNTWGLQITGDQQVMWTQPTSGTLLHHTVMGERDLARAAVEGLPSYHVVIPSPKSFPAMTATDMAYVQVDHVGSFTAAAGSVIYQGGSWPDEFKGDFFTTEPTINIVHHERLEQVGSSWAGHKLPGREETEFIRSTDWWWRPIEVRVGPDGAMYVLDFYNQAVSHNDSRGPDHNLVNAAVRPDRDHYYGRIWRVDHKDAAALPKVELSGADRSELFSALDHPNLPVRMQAHRLLLEGGLSAADVPADAAAWIAKFSADGKMASLWTLAGIAGADPNIAIEFLNDGNPDVRRTATRVLAILAADAVGTEKSDQMVQTALLGKFSDADPGVRIAALNAIANLDQLDSTSADALVKAWPTLSDGYQRSAALGAASLAPELVIARGLEGATPGSEELVGNLARLVAAQNRTDLAVRIVVGLPSASPDRETISPEVIALESVVLTNLGGNLRSLPEPSPALTTALGTLLKSPLAETALPLAVRWSGENTTSDEITALTDQLANRFENPTEPNAERIAAARALIAAGPRFQENLAPAIANALLESDSQDFKRALLASLAATEAPAIGEALTGVLDRLGDASRNDVFDLLLKRKPWTIGLLNAVADGNVDAATFGPGNAYRLRSHPDLEVAKLARQTLDRMDPQIAEKNKVIESLAAEVAKPGDPVAGATLYQAACATCHRFGEIGTDVGPALTGMGSHGSGELLTAIVDPNREVEPSYYAHTVKTRDGSFFSGAVARENQSTLVLKSLAGEQEIRKSEIENRENTRLSLMPEGFEALGAEGLRNIIAYLQEGEGGRFRTLDMRESFTTSTANGLFQARESRDDTIALAQTGTVRVGEIPFNVIAADRGTNGNVVVLRGGGRGSFARSLPRSTEIPGGGFSADRIHLLGGVAGWGAREAHEGAPVMTVSVVGRDGTTKEFTTRNGVEFADYNARIEVPGSKAANELVTRGQLRWFTLELGQQMEIDQIVLQSPGGGPAPVVLAITAEAPMEPAATQPDR